MTSLTWGASNSAKIAKNGAMITLRIDSELAERIKDAAFAESDITPVLVSQHPDTRFSVLSGE